MKLVSSACPCNLCLSVISSYLVVLWSTSALLCLPLSAFTFLCTANSCPVFCPTTVVEIIPVSLSATSHLEHTSAVCMLSMRQRTNQPTFARDPLGRPRGHSGVLYQLNKTDLMRKGKVCSSNFQIRGLFCKECQCCLAVLRQPNVHDDAASRSILCSHSPSLPAPTTLRKCSLCWSSSHLQLRSAAFSVHFVCPDSHRTCVFRRGW